jgi:N-acetylmuramoyl-L-alanine amidase
MALAVVAAACGGDGDPAEVSSGIETVDAGDASRARADLALSADDDSAGQTASTVAPTTVTTYAAITEETLPPNPDERVMITPTGVLVGVTGRTDDGVVVETPCGGLTLIDFGQPVGDIQIVLDPGHGGDEQGATDVPELTEAALNLALARQTRDVLEARSITAILTRDGDYRIPITQRAALADLMAPEAFISIHHNTPASRPSPTPGTEVFVQNNSEVSKRLGGLLYEEVFAALDTFDVNWTARDDAGVLVVLNEDGEDAYGIARYPTTPSALVELAYLGNPAEAELLATPEYVTTAAVALADGIERFLTSEDPGSGFIDTPRTFTPLTSSGGSTGCVDPRLQ